MKAAKQVLLLALLAGVMIFTGCSSNLNKAEVTVIIQKDSSVTVSDNSVEVKNNPVTVEDKVQDTQGGKTMQWNTPPAMQIDTSKTYFATVDTSLGKFKIKLFANESPKTVNNFVFLSQQGFYDSVIFHRIIKTFMIQTGDPTGTGGGGPGYRFADELPTKHSYDTGIVAMANAGPNTNGSQFFICTGAESKNLNYQPNYTQFGQITEGMDVVQKIAATPVGPGNPGENSRPTKPPVINKITITQQ